METEHGPRCDMLPDCKGAIAYVDSKGFVYCAPHGAQRKQGGNSCRKLRPSEIKKLEAGKTLSRY